MPLYIKDDEVDRLARRYQTLARLTSKTEAVRRALQTSIDGELAKPMLEDIAVAFCRDLRRKADLSIQQRDQTGDLADDQAGDKISNREND